MIGGVHMKKTWKNFWTDMVILVQMLCLAATGAILKWVLPPGSGYGHGAGRGLGNRLNRGAGPEELLGMTRHEWGEVHFYIAASLIAVLAIHLVLHWSWIKNRTSELFRTKRPG